MSLKLGMSVVWRDKNGCDLRGILESHLLEKEHTYINAIPTQKESVNLRSIVLSTFCIY